MQPVINIGLVGHVDHGKTTLTEALTGKWTDTHSEEIKRGITIRLGYADVEFRLCPKCKGSEAFTTAKECKEHKVPTDFIRKVSFVDAPGHESLMATMLSGARIMDGAMLLIAANESCPQPQTREHLMALQISGIKNVVVVQNKVDLVDKERALRNYNQIKDFLSETEYADAPIIPVSASHKVNLGFLIEALEKHIPTPDRSKDKKPIMFIARSFDINKPGTNPKDLTGGIIGGSLVSGEIKIGDRIEIRPGRLFTEANQLKAESLFARVEGIMTGRQTLDVATPGGSIALLTSLDPTIVKSDALVGNLVGKPGDLPEVWHNLTLETHLLDRVVGSEDELKVENIKPNEALMLNVNSAATVGFVTEIKKDMIRCRLKLPICADADAKVTISRRIGNRFRLIGYGIIKKQ
ncbi:translation initiation factor IF-2 subunit gamma [Candidatus Woesearchaeota archaeon]|nr:translation initiation factor IF-2 subunit gamma [Candidatus Woesearchaeota archaeon]